MTILDALALLFAHQPWVIGPLLAFIVIALPLEVAAAVRMWRS